VSRVSQTLDRIHATFDDDNPVGNAGLLLPATLVNPFGIETVSNADGSSRQPGRWSVN
jgi:hypothetical protein